jgi:hypothetical protein
VRGGARNALAGRDLGETRPFVTATHQVDHGGLARHGTDSRVRRGDPLPTRRSCVSLLEAQCHVSVRYRKKQRYSRRGTEIGTFRGAFREHALLDGWKPGSFLAFRDGGSLDLRPVGIVLVTHGLVVDPSQLMAASRSSTRTVLPRHRLRVNARIFPQLGSWHRARYPVGFAHEQHLIAATAHQFLSATRWPASPSIILIKSHAVSHITHRKYKEEDVSFLDILI